MAKKRSLVMFMALIVAAGWPLRIGALSLDLAGWSPAPIRPRGRPASVWVRPHGLRRRNLQRSTNYVLKQGVTTVADYPTNRTATLTPDAPLLADKRYVVSLTPATKDLAGNPLAAKTWNFITGPRPQ